MASEICKHQTSLERIPECVGNTKSSRTLSEYIEKRKAFETA